MARARTTSSAVKPHILRLDSHLAYLSPPCLHDPASVSDVASLPPATIQTLPEAAQLALYNLQQSTSIVFASYSRLQALLQDRFDRLMPSVEPDGDITFSESSFFNYTNSLGAERTYLLSDAYPDWRHKASLARAAIQPYGSQPLDVKSLFPDTPRSLSEWWECLESAVASWCEYATILHVPEYEDTVSEYLSIQKRTPALALDLDDTPFETPFATLTPTSEKAFDPVRIDEISVRDFEPSRLPNDTQRVASVKDPNDFANVCKLAHAISEEFHTTDGRILREERSDSGVGMIC